MTTHEQVLAAVEAARSRTRRVKRAGWIPLLVFGILVLPAVAFHLHGRAVTDAPGYGLANTVTYLFEDSNGGPGLFWYWQIAIPLGYLVIAGLYAWRNRRAGVRTPVRTYVVTGVVLVVALYYVENVGVWRFGWGDLTIHGMEATITIGLSLFVLAWLERSVALTVSAVVVTAAALLASLYDIENLWYQWFGLDTSGWLGVVTNDLTLSATLLLCAAVVALVDRTRTRPVTTA